jgi:hypothetical protein
MCVRTVFIVPLAIADRHTTLELTCIRHFKGTSEHWCPTAQFSTSHCRPGSRESSALRPEPPPGNHRRPCKRQHPRAAYDTHRLGPGSSPEAGWPVWNRSPPNVGVRTVSHPRLTISPHGATVDDIYSKLRGSWFRETRGGPAPPDKKLLSAVARHSQHRCTSVQRMLRFGLGIERRSRFEAERRRTNIGGRRPTGSRRGRRPTGSG